MKKKVLIISHEYPPIGGGAGVVAEDTVKKLVDNDIQVTVVTNKDKVNNRKLNVIYNLVEVNTYPRIRFINFWNKLKDMNLNSFDKIILNDIGAAMVGTYFFDKSLLKKTIVFLHGSEPEQIFKTPNLTFKLLNFREKYIEMLSECFKIVAVSYYMKEKFLSYTVLKNIKDKIVVIYNGIDEEMFYPDPMINLKKTLNISSESKVLLSVGRIIREKGFENMYHIFKEIQINNNYHWVIIGDGDFKKELKSKVKLDKLDSFIHFIGNVKRESLRGYYSAADIFWLLSNLDEALGLVYLEAQFCNTFAIGRDNSGVKEAIINGETGYLVKNDEEVISVLRNFGSKNTDSHSFNNVKDKFSNEKCTAKLLELI